MQFISGIVVGCFGVFLIALSVLCAFLPSKAGRFLATFASSAQTHFLEQAIRLIVGAALIIFSSEMRFPDIFNLFGWIVVVTTFGLLLIPWRFHRRFSRMTIPQVTRHLRLFAFGAFALGIFLFYGMSQVFFPR